MVTGTLDFFLCMVAEPALNQLDQLPRALSTLGCSAHNNIRQDFYREQQLGTAPRMLALYSSMEP